MEDHLRNLIFQAIDKTISEDDFDQLQNAIESQKDVRQEYLRAVRLCESLGDIAAGSDELHVSSPSDVTEHSASRHVTADSRSQIPSEWPWQKLAIAAALLAVVGGLAFWSGQRNRLPTEAEVAIVEQPMQHQEDGESLIAGHATLRSAVDLRWSEDASSYREGDVLPDGRLQFDAGVAEIDFFCGATLVVEGPAVLEVESDWSVRVLQGRLRASVPPAARGFIVHAADSQIVDLGTEFAVEVGSGSARVEVIDGEVELRGGQHDGNHLFTGERRLLQGDQVAGQPIKAISSLSEVQRRREDAELQQFVRWQNHSRQLRSNDHLVAYYPIADAAIQRFVPNQAVSGKPFDGTLVGSVNLGHGRFGPKSQSVEFHRPGSRVRARIDGQFAAFTFACWVRIDSLEHKYNSLFMGDGYENGEPHWQIHEDGRMMFSVMVDDTPGSGLSKEKDSRFHRIYYTPPIWDVSQSGQWIHLAAVYDPAKRFVTQFVNGRQISREEIPPEFHVEQLRIGAAEIGNWGQPLRKSPWFAVRNLNGAIDELAIFDAPLSAEQIDSLFEQGKPIGY